MRSGKTTTNHETEYAVVCVVYTVTQPVPIMQRELAGGPNIAVRGVVGDLVRPLRYATCARMHIPYCKVLHGRDGWVADLACGMHYNGVCASQSHRLL